jgi:hypothetical protein
MDRTYFCKDCMEKFNDKLSQDKHNWLKHPSNPYEKSWSDLYKSGKLFTERYSMAYQDDPFH